MKYTVRPISDRTAFTGKHKPNPFKTTWAKTLELLGDELGLLGAENVVIEIDITEGEIRLDGMPRVSAKAATPGVRIAFDSKHGPLTYATDRFKGQWSNDPPDWQTNVRAIALGLEALRAVDRYGISKRGEQYTGYRAIGSGIAMPKTTLTADEALNILMDHSHLDMGFARTTPTARLFKLARRNTHPDRNGGAHSNWNAVENAAKVLGLLS